tara:strand:- start:11462 stop:11824 length:363 start_codon:yes stop_codon:yes gene_type:complete
MRVILSSDAANDLKQMAKELKTNKGVSVTPSEITSWIVREFSSNHFESSKPFMIKAFTNLSKLVRENLKRSASNDELIAALRESLAASAMSKPPRRKSKGDSVSTAKADLKVDSVEKSSQ